MNKRTFGKKPSGARLDKIERSPNYRNDIFQNIEPTPVMRKDASYYQLMKEYAHTPKSVRPAAGISTVKTDLSRLTASQPVVVWFGHSSYFIKSGNFTMLVDPVFSGYASPVSFFGKAFKGADAYKAEDFPDIDLLVITHDHYDHLDYTTIVRLRNKVRKIVTPLGVGSHLEYWGIDAGKITELDWWESVSLTPDITLTATPARHFSGRKFLRNKTLWTSYVLNLHRHTLFLGGDSGYDAQFKKIGERFGPFDLAMVECGQYGDDWPFIHMKPEQTVQAALDLRARVLLPVHWGKFVLAMHPWTDSITRALAAAAPHTQLQVATPRIGEPYTIGGRIPSARWWTF